MTSLQRLRSPVRQPLPTERGKRIGGGFAEAAQAANTSQSLHHLACRMPSAIRSPERERKRLKSPVRFGSPTRSSPATDTPISGRRSNKTPSTLDSQQVIGDYPDFHGSTSLLSTQEALALVERLQNKLGPSTDKIIVTRAAHSVALRCRQDKRNIKTLHEAGCTSACVELLESHDYDQQEAALSALTAMSGSEDSCTAAASVGALPTLLALSGSRDKMLSNLAKMCLAEFAKFPDNVTEIAELRVTSLLSSLCTALENGTDSVNGARQVADVTVRLVRLCRNGLGFESFTGDKIKQPSGTSNVRIAVGELGGVGVLVSLLGSASAPVQLASLDALREIARCEANCYRIVESGGISMLHDLLTAGGSQSVQRRAKSALDILSTHANCKNAIDLHRAHTLIGEVRAGTPSARSLRGLSTLSRENVEACELMMQHNIVDNVVKLLNPQACQDTSTALSSPTIDVFLKENDELVRAAVDLLKELARNTFICVRAGQLGVLEHLAKISAAAVANGDHGLQRSANRALEVLQSAESNRDRIQITQAEKLVVGTCLCSLSVLGMSRHTELTIVQAKLDSDFNIPDRLTDHCKSIVQLCRDHVSIVRACWLSVFTLCQTMMVYCRFSISRG